MSSRAASGRKKLAKAASKDSAGKVTSARSSSKAPPLKPPPILTPPPPSPSPAKHGYYEPPVSAARYARTSSPFAEERRSRSPMRFPSLSPTSPTLGSSPLRMDSSLSPSVSPLLPSSSPRPEREGYVLRPERNFPSSRDLPQSPLSPIANQPSQSSLSGSSDTESSASSRRGRNTARNAIYQHAPTPDDANLPSSFSISSGSTDSTRSPAAFVFPSSRSRGHPNLTDTGKVPKFKFKLKKTKGKESQGASLTTYASSSSGSSGTANVHRTNPSSPPPFSSTPSPHSSPVLATSPTPTTVSNNPASDFVFPSSRSRAHPSSPPTKLRLPPRKKSGNSQSSVDSWDATQGKRRFMGIPFGKKKQELADPVFPSSGNYSDDFSPMRRSFDDVSLIGSGFGPYEDSIRSSWIPAQSAKQRDSYPLDPYDAILLEQDRLTTGLLRRLNSSDGPSFHHYGNNPPSSVLDLGCGQGHWILDAATTWKGYGTRITGFDMVDIMKSLRPVAVRNGVVGNIDFVKGNFVKDPLPFPDESFDLVRMSGLTYTISFEKWRFVLREVCRVLTVGGRLEMIDDHIFFPYGRPPEPTHQSIGIPEVDESDTATLGGGRQYVPSLPTEVDNWTEQASGARELESLFEHMHNMKFGIHLCPTQFIVGMMEQVFGHANEIRTIHLTLAPPEPELNDDGGYGIKSRNITEEGTHPLLNSPGLILWPSTFIPMSRSEIEIHSLKHPRVLLSLKSALINHALDIAEEGEVDQEAVKESLWEYEGFLQDRFNAPKWIATSASDTKHTRHGSHISINSVSSEGQSVLKEYQSVLRGHVSLSTDSDYDSDSPPHTPRQETTPTRDLESAMSDATYYAAPSMTSLPSFTSQASARLQAAPPPDYSKHEQTHIRTFHVFEAIKMDETLLGAAI